jgi:hypothetical protein
MGFSSDATSVFLGGSTFFFSFDLPYARDALRTAFKRSLKYLPRILRLSTEALDPANSSHSIALTPLSAIPIPAFLTYASAGAFYVCPERAFSSNSALSAHQPRLYPELLLLQLFANSIGIATVIVSPLCPKIRNRIQIP